MVVVKVDGRRVQNHIDALSALFVLRPLQPSPLGVGKTIYLIFDAGLCAHLGAPLRRRWQSWFLNEWLNQRRFLALTPDRSPTYYRTSRGSFIDFVLGSRWVLFSESPAPDRRDRMTIKAATKNAPRATFTVMCATEDEGGKIEKNTLQRPWSLVAEFPRQYFEEIERYF